MRQLDARVWTVMGHICTQTQAAEVIATFGADLVAHLAHPTEESNSISNSSVSLLLRLVVIQHCLRLRA